MTKIYCDDKKCIWNAGGECISKMVSFQKYGDIHSVKVCLDRDEGKIINGK